MANVNKVILIGNLTRDPELKYLPSQTAVCEFGLAVNRRWTAQDGTQKEETTFVDCSSFGRQAETLSKYVKKGNPLFVEGRLKLDQWEAQDGSKRSKMRVVIENFQFLGGRSDNAGGGAPAAEGYSGEAGAPRQQPRPAAKPLPTVKAVAPAHLPCAQRPAAAPNYDAGDANPPEEAPPLSDEDIPF